MFLQEAGTNQHGLQISNCCNKRVNFPNRIKSHLRVNFYCYQMRTICARLLFTVSNQNFATLVIHVSKTALKNLLNVYGLMYMLCSLTSISMYLKVLDPLNSATQAMLIPLR